MKAWTWWCSGFVLIVWIWGGVARAEEERFAKAAYRGFMIPQIDLSDQSDFQVEIARDPDVYMGHPSSVLLDDGRTVLIFYLNQHGKGRLMWRRSTDGGKTWSEDLPLPEGWDEPVVVDGESHEPFLEIPIVYKIDGRDGVQRLVLYTAGRDFYPARYAVSEDDGESWSRLEPILAGGEPVRHSIVLFSDMIQLKDGRYLFTYHEPGKVFTVTSADGVTFDKPKLAAAYDGAFLCEGGFVRSPDGDTIALLMRENNRVYNSMISFSKDEGETWSEPRQMPDSLTGDRHQHTYGPDGRLLISFRDRGANSPTEGDWVAWVGTFNDLVDGNEGGYRVRMKDNFKGNDCAYPSQHLLPDGSIFLATYGCWERGSPNYLIGFHIRLEELDRIVADSGDGIVDQG
ncbi:MAG: sialidase family protein [Verrucomicrobiota bacterium]